jgi:hypothetical protein
MSQAAVQDLQMTTEKYKRNEIGVNSSSIKFYN